MICNDSLFKSSHIHANEVTGPGAELGVRVFVQIQIIPFDGGAPIKAESALEFQHAGDFITLINAVRDTGRITDRKLVGAVDGVEIIDDGRRSLSD